MLKRIILNLKEIDKGRYVYEGEILTGESLKSKMQSIYQCEVEGVEPGWRIETVSNRKLLHELEFIKSGYRDSLMITDSAENALLVKGYEIPCILYKQDLMISGIYGIDLIIEDLGSIDMRTITWVYNHHYELPCRIVRTKRLLIRESQVSDLEEFYHIYGNTQYNLSVKQLSQDPMEEAVNLKSYIKNMYGLYGYGLWSVVDLKSGKLIGRVGLEHTEYHGEIVTELGFLIGEPWRQRGYAMEAARAVIDYAFRYLDLSQVYIRAFSGNTASCHLAERLGFHLVEEGEIRYYIWIREDNSER